MLRQAISALGMLLFACSAPAADDATREDALRDLVRQAVASGDDFVDRYDAEVWLVDMSARLVDRPLPAAERIALLRHAHREARRAGLQPELVLAVIEVESGFDRFAISETGALGLMQVMPFWLEELARPEANLLDMQTNLRIGTTILRYYLDLEAGDLRLALARYNGTPGEAPYPDRVFRALNRNWYR